MIVCLDVSPAVHHRAGSGRYAQELTAALVAIDPENEHVAFYNRPSEARIDPPLDQLPHLTTTLPNKFWRMSVLLAHFARLPQDRLFPSVDLFHATDHLLPWLSCVKSVFTLHDLTFCLHSQMHSSWNRWFLTLMVPRFLRAANAVIADSECTKGDATRLYGIDEAKIKVIYPGVKARFHPADSETIEAARARYSLPERFILFVGTIEPRKNLNTLLEAYQALRSRGSNFNLVIVGKTGWLYESLFRRLRELGVEGEVAFPGFIPDVDLPALYSAADLFVFPSLYEGFGLPPLEAMACGTPVIVSDTSSLPEVVGDAGLLVDPYDVKGLAIAIERVLTDAQLQTEMRTKGLERAKQFTWEKAARETLAVYETVVAGR